MLGSDYYNIHWTRSSRLGNHGQCIAASSCREQKENSQAFYYIQQGLEDWVFPNIGVVDHAKKALDILEVSYQGNNKVKTTKLDTLRKCFQTLSMKESDCVDNFMTQVKNVIN